MKSSPVAILDIGSDRVLGGVLTRGTKEDKKPFLNYLFTTKKELPYQENLDPARLLNESLTAAKQVIEELAASKTKPEQTYCFLSSPFYASQTRIAKLQKDAAFNVTSKLLGDLVRTEAEKFKQTGARLLDQKVMQTKLNRYVTTKPERKKAKELELDLFFSQGEDTIIKQLEEMIRGRLHHRRPEFHAGTLTFFSAIRDLKPERPSALILHVSGEITELSLFSDRVLAETVSYPIGYNFLIRELTTRLGSPAAEVLSRLKLHLAGDAKETENEKMTEMVGEFGVRFLTAVKEMLRTLGENHFLPGEIFLILDNRFVPIFEQWLKGADLAATGIMRKNLAITILENNLWADWQPSDVNAVIPDVALILDGIFYAKIADN